MTELEPLYQQRAHTFEQEANVLKQKYDTYSFVRLASFILGLGLVIYLFTFHWLVGTAALMLFLAGFYRFMLWHQAIQDSEKHHRNLSTINKLEAEVLGAHIYDKYESGENYIDPMHPYSLDLDIFGPYSVFQYTNRTATVIGRNRLADYLKGPAEAAEIRARQEAIAELKDQLDWRQHFQAFGMETEDEFDHVRLLQLWLKAEPFVSNDRWLIFSFRLMPIWMIIGTVLSVFYLPWQIILAFLIWPVLIIRRTVQRVNTTHLQTTHAEKTLAFYAKLIKHLEDSQFQSSKLRSLHQQFLQDNETASRQIRKLSYIIAQLNLRYNVFAIFFNVYALWDLYWVYRLEKWKIAQKDSLLDWFDSLSAFEALCSFANLHYNNSDWVFPQFNEDDYFEGQQLGHPLIKEKSRVCNDLRLPTDGHIKLVTGSNMAGKSTFLRTVGLNIVLANAGAPVCAQVLQLPRMQVYTSMRTQDALHESTSSFYAELKRLKFIIEAVEKGDNIFFLLDEILKGTNSKDRHTGAKALIRQLIKSKGSGIIATHDLELGQLEASAEGAIENLRMEVEIKDGKLFFDYTLKKGVSESFNATLLMQNMGIKI